MNTEHVDGNQGAKLYVARGGVATEHVDIEVVNSENVGEELVAGTHLDT